jgi:hypothetical protein
MILVGFDTCILGYTDEEITVYSKERIIEKVILDFKLEYDEALDYCYFNIFQSYVGEKTPIFINEIDK